MKQKGEGIHCRDQVLAVMSGVGCRANRMAGLLWVQGHGQIWQREDATPPSKAHPHCCRN